MPTTSQAAARANVALNTVRNYVRDYPDLFSEGARGLQGNRRFSEDDVEVLCTLVELKNSGMSLADAVDRLRTQEAPTIIDVPSTQPSTSLQEAPDAANILQLIQSATQPQMDALRLEIAEVKARQSTASNLLVTGIVIGAAITLVVVAIALSMVK